MNAVLTVSQAKQITGGRTPLVPVEYEAAINALQACVTLDEAKYWSDKSDALAAWAKIYHNDKASVEAKRLKLHAFKRMGELANDLRPRRNTAGGAVKGPRSLLIENGLRKEHADVSLRLSRLPEREFSALVERPRPPSPTAVRQYRRSKGEAWNAFAASSRSAVIFRSFCRAYSAAELAHGLSLDEAKKAKEIAAEISEWLDEFDQVLQSRLKVKK